MDANKHLTELLSTQEAARILGRKQQTLRLWRVRGGGPPYVKMMGRYGRVAYRRVDLETWITERIYSSTSEETASRTAR